MARIIYREDFAGQVELFRNIKAKHDDDGASSPLTTMLTDKGIDLTADATAADNAEGAEKTRADLCRKGEDYREKRDLKAEPVFKNLRPMIQFLKSYYNPNVHALGDWGVTVDGNRIAIPSDFDLRDTLFIDVKAKHVALAASSPLTPFLTLHNIDLGDGMTKLVDASTFNVNMAQAKRDSEDAREDRDNYWKDVDTHCHTIGDFLKKLYFNNPQQLGYWGFTVDESPQEPKFRISKVQPSDQTTTNAIVLGSTFTNLGSVELKVYKGKNASGSFVIVPPGEMLGMIKGYSMITVTNASTTLHGSYKTLVYR